MSPPVLAIGTVSKYILGHRNMPTDMNQYFECTDIKSNYLKNLLIKTIRTIIQSGFQSEVLFGTVIEGQTIAGGIAEVTGDHCIRINAQRLRQYEEDIAMALLAHELAHDHLLHFKTWQNNLDHEHTADNLARQWGFDIDRFRKICGPPYFNSRLQQIAVIN